MKFALGDLVIERARPTNGVMRVESIGNGNPHAIQWITVEGGAFFYEQELAHCRYAFNMTAEHIEDIQHAMAALAFCMQNAVGDGHPKEMQRAYDFLTSMIDLPVVTTDGTQEGRNAQN